MAENLLVIMSDEHQARAMGCSGHPFVKTPNLDRLAEDGIRFTNAYTPSPICVPARASFASGQYVHKNRLWDNAMPYTGEPKGWGHTLQNIGIPVESIGKLHYRHEEDLAGFDVEHIPMQVVDGVGMVWASIRKEDERVRGPTRMLGEYIGPGQSKYTQYDQAVTDKTVEWLEGRAWGNYKPWCLYVGLVAPHFPLVVPQEFYDLYPLDSLPEPKLHPGTGYELHPWNKKLDEIMESESKFHDKDERRRAFACYYGLCSWMDHNVGRIVEALKNNGLFENTTIVYTSDHGDNVGARGLWGKSNMYEESAAIPLIISGPNTTQSVCQTPVSLVDLAATIPHHFGTRLEQDSPGQSLYDIASEMYDPSRVVFSEYHAVGAVSGAFMIRKADWKYIYYVGFEPELYDLKNDPEETMNLASMPHNAAKRSELHAELLAICDPHEMDRLAHADQAAMVMRYGGRDAALKLGAPGATPPPPVNP